MSPRPLVARWFDEAQVAEAVASLEGETERIRRASADELPPPMRPDDSQKLAWGVVALVLGMLLILVVLLTLFGKRDPNHQIDARGYITLGLIFVGLPTGLFFGTKYFWGVRTKLLRERDGALQALAARVPSLKHGRMAKITGPSAGAIPWLASEIDVVVECDLCGEFRGHRLAMLQCTYVVDTTLTALESSLGGVAASVMSHVQHEHVHRRSLTAVVFFDPVPSLPDAFSAAKKQPLNWYFKRQLLKNGEEAPTPLADAARWIVASDAEAGRQLIQAPTAAHFQAAPEALLQVLGGYVVAIPALWLANHPTEMPCTDSAIEQNLNWACEVYESLCPAGAGPAMPRRPQAAGSRAAAGGAVGVALVEALAPARAQPLAAETRVVAPARPTRTYKPRTALQIGAGLLGLCLAGMGSLGVLGLLALNAKAEGAKSWPTVEGRIVSAEVAERSGPEYSARIKYTYEVGSKRYNGDKATLVNIDWQADRAAVEAAVAARQPGAVAKVYYNPKSHEEAVLEPRITDGGLGAFVMGVSVAAVFVGLALVVVGIRRTPVAA